jgi:DNA-binding beta-propeller fold protein YncE
VRCRLRLALAFLLAAPAAGAVGCGSAAPAPAQLSRAAQPARAPATAIRPAGRVRRVGALADAVVADPNAHIFAVAVHDPSRLILVSARTGRIRERVAIPTGTQRAGAPPPAPAVFLVPAETGRRALAIQPALRTPAGELPPGAALVLGRTFVADARAAAVVALDRGRPTRTLPATIHPGGLVAADFDRRLAVVATRERTLALYDPRTLRRIAQLPAGAGPTNIVAGGDRLYVADTRGDAILVFATDAAHRSLTRAGRLALPRGSAPYGLALDPVRRRLWITLTARNELVSLPIDGRDGPTRRFPTVRQPDAVAVDSALGTVAVTGRAQGVIQLIGADVANGADESARAALRRPLRTGG